jgi:hypothetical protein
MQRFLQLLYKRPPIFPAPGGWIVDNESLHRGSCILIVDLALRERFVFSFSHFAPSCIPEFPKMPTNDPTSSSQPSLNEGFRLSGGPVAFLSEDQENEPELVELAQLPRVYGEPILFAIARDPRTLFTYWNIDWPGVFAKIEPVDRQVYLRVNKADGAEESESLVEPMLGSYYARVAQPRGTYRVEIGYYQPASEWHSITTSDEVVMPPESVSEKVDVDVATVPFHLSFQRIVDLFRSTNDGAITETISHLQERASHKEEALTAEEHEILRAMDLSLADLAAARRAYLDSGNREVLRKRLESLLGYGSSSPTGGFGGSNRG